LSTAIITVSCVLDVLKEPAAVFQERSAGLLIKSLANANLGNLSCRVACALVMNPEIYMFDEPTLASDPELTRGRGS
jgi:ABC-type arginine transport system ATPase subunit